VQFWFYAQLDIIGRTGRADPDLGVFGATVKLMSQQRRWLRARRRGEGRSSRDENSTSL